jgi:hypothetical protein
LKGFYILRYINCIGLSFVFLNGIVYCGRVQEELSGKVKASKFDLIRVAFKKLKISISQNVFALEFL